jgi:hypothetical protein
MYIFSAEAAKHAQSVCQEYSPENALFLFPWGADNAFHGMNDNVFSVLCSAVLHFLLSPEEEDTKAQARGASGRSLKKRDKKQGSAQGVFNASSPVQWPRYTLYLFTDQDR